MFSFILLIILLNTLNGLTSSENQSYDNPGHLGGLFVGIFMGFILLDPVISDERLITGKVGNFQNTKVRIISLLVLTLYFFGGFFTFYTFRYPK